ncbi:hypothetical protein BDY21DRAFT_218357 [Lineolata rhizophorae]|uniref:Uncharacterized protein n=1 Tax=Lineolata rhizophorae TaxID=578093 RepID=A0A6A6P387_9PEZI|nr:hypothetical protein BDY21DRAFT_218357 [Lineolata rhizophorae]
MCRPNGRRCEGASISIGVGTSTDHSVSGQRKMHMTLLARGLHRRALVVHYGRSGGGRWRRARRTAPTHANASGRLALRKSSPCSVAGWRVRLPIVCNDRLEGGLCRPICANRIAFSRPPPDLSNRTTPSTPSLAPRHRHFPLSECHLPFCGGPARPLLLPAQTPTPFRARAPRDVPIPGNHGPRLICCGCLERAPSSPSLPPMADQGGGVAGAGRDRLLEARVPDWLG